MIAITMGDPNGVGPELVLKAWRAGDLHEAEAFERGESRQVGTEALARAPERAGAAGGVAQRSNRSEASALPPRAATVVIGDLAVLESCSARLGYEVPLRAIADPGEVDAEALNVIDLGAMAARKLAPGELSAEAGRAARAYIERAVRLALERRVDAVVTLPVNKEAVRLTDPGFTGHTEMIAELCGATRVAMMLATERLAVTHVSTHVSLAEAIRRVKRERILDVIHLTHGALSRFLPAPRIAVAGVNPHAGEHGSFGREEIEEISPAIAAAREDGLVVSGPEAPDTVFVRAVKGAFDAVVCMYHDQGHIPAKLLDFEGGVNITLGLPIVRTSVDHGTAFDIAYRGIASTKSLVAAYHYAVQLIGGPPSS